MSTVELSTQPPMSEQPTTDDLKKSLKTQTQTPNANNQEKHQHPLHQFDLTVMSKFYEACVGKFKEQNPTWHPTEWAIPKPTETLPTTKTGCNPLVLSLKQQVYEAFNRLAKESGEPMILMPNFDYGDIFNFVRFLQNLKTDGINSIGKYKNYLNNKDLRKFEVDLVVIHPKFGILLFEIKDCDHLDNKRRSKTKAQLSNARSCFDSIARLLIEAKGWTQSEAKVPISEFIALPNVLERPQTPTQAGHLQTPGGNQNHSATSTSSIGRHYPRQLNYLIRGDLENPEEFSKWWTRYVAEPMTQHQQAMEAENKTNKFDLSIINWMTGLLNSIRNNTIMPVVYPEMGAESLLITLPEEKQQETQKTEQTPTTTEPTGQQQQPGEQEHNKTSENKPGEETTPTTETPKDKEAVRFQPALNVYAEFFQKEHETVRSLSKVVIISKNAERVRKTICLQTLWLLLNDSQKKISVVCSEMNKPYYEEFFSRQRKLYNNLNNLRFYVNLESCTVNSQNTLKKDGEIWFFDSGIKGTMDEILERAKNLNAFWIFTTDEESLEKCKPELETIGTKYTKLDDGKQTTEQEKDLMPWLTGGNLKLPMRLHCDLLIIGDIIGLNQTNLLYRYLKTNYISSHPSHQSGSYHQYHSQQQQLSFNPTKKFKTIKFIRGGTIDNLRTSLKMHDSIQTQVVLIHVGDEDLFKTRNSLSTIERVKELSTLVKEYCPKSFIVLSTLMRRMSRTENGVINEVNKGIVSFCKQTRETSNLYHMLNNHFEPDYHTQEGRVLSAKGLRLYTDNLLFMVDNFLIRNNKQH